MRLGEREDRQQQGDPSGVQGSWSPAHVVNQQMQDLSASAAASLYVTLPLKLKKDIQGLVLRRSR